MTIFSQLTLGTSNFNDSIMRKLVVRNSSIKAVRLKFRFCRKNQTLPSLAGYYITPPVFASHPDKAGADFCPGAGYVLVTRQPVRDIAAGNQRGWGFGGQTIRARAGKRPMTKGKTKQNTRETLPFAAAGPQWYRSSVLRSC